MSQLITPARRAGEEERKWSISDLEWEVGVLPVPCANS